MPDKRALSEQIKRWGSELGFQSTGISDIHLQTAETHLQHWLAEKMHGDMSFMSRHGTKRTRPEELIPGTVSIISVTMNYLPASMSHCDELLQQSEKAYISCYALGRDYHKVMKKRLELLAKKIKEHYGSMGYRVFTDSAPVMEKAIAEKAGLGWIGKHSNLIHEKAGSWFFLGEIYTDLPLFPDTPGVDHCGTCQACITACPTKAIVKPYVVDSRLCISYLTIELKSAIPETLRPYMGNRIYGCDDCQLCCPWNRFAKTTRETDYLARKHFDTPELTELFQWTEVQFLKNTEGSAIRRIGHERWQRNIAVALGNALKKNKRYYDTIKATLIKQYPIASVLVREHIDWALKQEPLD